MPWLQAHDRLKASFLELHQGQLVLEAFEFRHLLAKVPQRAVRHLIEEVGDVLALRLEQTAQVRGARGRHRTRARAPSMLTFAIDSRVSDEALTRIFLVTSERRFC